MATTTHFFLLVLFTLTLVVHARLNLLFFNVSKMQTCSYENAPKRYIFSESKSSTNQTSPIEAPNHKHMNRKINKRVGFVLSSFAALIAGLSSGYIVKLLLIKFVLSSTKNTHSLSGPTSFCQSIAVEDLAFLDDDEVFATLPVIGRGGCGQVRKIDLQNGKIKTIAIKKVIKPLIQDVEELTRTKQKKVKQIESEIQTVGLIRHRNLVSLLAHVPRLTCHYLVYEFMENGSLLDILKQVQDGTRELDWLARHRIAMGVAFGLEYLHTSTTPRIVHRDIKPANVLLDDDMQARISDFGLARYILEDDTHITFSDIAGSMGFRAPEYCINGKFTDKCDVYSFGVLLGVLVNGKHPTDAFFKHAVEMDMMTWMKKVMASGHPDEAIHPSLLGKGYDEQMFHVLRIAFFCTSKNPKDRPTSKDCRCMLAQITSL